MKRALPILILIATALPGASVFRIDPTPVMTTAGNAPVGGNPALYAVANSSISLCSDAACATPATAYANAAGTIACPINAPVTLPGSTTCQGTTGSQGQFGFWVIPGTYYYVVTTASGRRYGPYPITSPTAGAAGGPFSLSSSQYVWNFDDTLQGVGIFSQFSGLGGVSTYGPGVGEYHFYNHNAGNAGLGAIGKSVAWQSYMNAGNGGTLSGLWADTTANGTWTPQSGIGGVTNGVIGATIGATLAHSAGFQGGYAASMNTYATCAGPSPCAQVSAVEFDVSNNVVGTGGHAGLLVYDQSTEATVQTGGDYAYGAGAVSIGFKYGFFFDFAMAANGTLWKADHSTVVNGLDWSGITFTGHLLDLPGFILDNGGTLVTALTVQPTSATDTPVSVVSVAKTSGPFLSFTHSTSAFNGNVVLANMALSSGSFTGNFEQFLVNSVTKWAIDSTGTPTSPALKSTTGTRFLCVDTAGKFVSSTTACSGT